MIIKTLTKSYLQQHLNEILNIDHIRMGKVENWTSRNFILDLPLKFQLSLTSISDKQVIGYIIASKKEKTCHIHRIAVSAQYSDQGIGSKMISVLGNKAKSKNLKKLSVEALKKDNLKRFYLKNGFQPLNKKDQKVYSIQKDPKIRDLFLEKYSVFMKDL